MKKIRFQLDWYPDAERGGYICALVNGFYRQAGLDVEIIPASPNVSVLSSLMFGNADICMAASDLVLLMRGQGLPIVSIMATMQHDPQAVMVHADSPVKTFAELEGHTVATTPGAIWFQYVAKKYQLHNVHEQRLGFGVANFMNDPNAIQQVFITSEPYACQEHQVPIRTLLVRDSGWDTYRVAATTDNFLATNPAAVKAFVDASIKGWKAYFADPTATDAEILRRNPQITLDELKFSREKLAEGNFVTGNRAAGEAVGKLDPARIEMQYHILRDLGVLKNDFDERKSFTTQFCNNPP